MTGTIEHNQNTSNGDTPPHYEEVIQQDIARAAGMDNRAFESDPSDVRILFPTQHAPPVPPRISNMIAVDYPNDPDLGPDVDELEKKEYNEVETQMLTVIREVVRRCTHINPHKRPTAAEMLKLLKTIRVPELEKPEGSQEGAVANAIVH